MTTAVMLDIETMGFCTSSVVLSFGAVKFDPWTIEEPRLPLYHRLDVDSQLELGRTTDDSTMEWWAAQASDVQEEAFAEDDRTSLAAFTGELNKYLVGVDEIWAHGTTFDIVILESMYRDLGLPTPWVYGKVRDSRTLFGLFGDPRKRNAEQAHNALADAWYQAMAVQATLRTIVQMPTGM
jgi:hypothetical protein